MVDSVKKVRTFFGQRSYYYDTHDKDGNLTSAITVDEWKQKIVDDWTSVECSWLAMIFHDRDVLADGNIKPLHVHIVINFKNARSFASVAKLLGISREQNLQKCKSIADSARYLTHISETAINEGKTFYQPSEVIVAGSDAKDYSELIKRGKGKSVIREEIDDSKKLTTDDKLLIDYEWSKLAAKVQAGEMSKKSVKSYLLDTFGDIKGQMAWLSKRGGFDEDFKEYMEKMHNFYSSNPRELDTFYISGQGGIGKTQLATAISEILSNELGVHKVAVPGRGTTFDFAGGYRGERVTVANDLATGSFHCRQWCNIFDPLEYSPINSRNFDKPWFARFCLITNSEDVEMFIKKMIYFSGVEYQNVGSNRVVLNNDQSTKNMVIQVRRRIKYNLKIDIDASGFKYVDVQILKGDFSGFESVERIPFRDMFDEKSKIAEKIITKLCVK
jgi:hypothetical protein